MDKFYAVRRGFKTGILKNLEELNDSIKGYPKADGKLFKVEDDAIYYLYGAEGILQKYTDFGKVENKI